MELFQVARSYDFSDVQVTVGGLRIGGFGEAGGVNIEPQSEISMMKMGADGEVVISKLPLPSYVVTLTLMETSVSNGTLAGLLMIQRNAPSGFVLPFAEMLGREVAPWDFRVDGVTTISADIHKLGYAPKGVSVILHRDKQSRAYQTFVFDDWLGGFYASPNLQGTRSGLPMRISVPTTFCPWATAEASPSVSPSRSPMAADGTLSSLKMR
jgi:hypothetical protein